MIFPFSTGLNGEGLMPIFMSYEGYKSTKNTSLFSFLAVNEDFPIFAERDVIRSYHDPTSSQNRAVVKAYLHKNS